MERKYVITAFGYGLAGLAFGIYMAASKNHGQLVTHAHIMLLGFVVSFIYGVCHKLWLSAASVGLARVQYYAHQIGTLVLVVSLFLMYGGFAGEEVLGPFLGISSLMILVGMVIMTAMFIKHR